MKIKLYSLPNLFTVNPLIGTETINPLPYGLAVLNGYLKNHGYNPKIVDLWQEIFSFKRSLGNLNFNLLLRPDEVLGYLTKKKASKALDKLVLSLVEVMQCRTCDLIGFSVMSYWNMILALILIVKIKEISSAQIVFGGAFMTMYKKAIFDEFPFIKDVGPDYIILGDGQVPLLELVKYIDRKKSSLKAIPNLIRRKNKEFIFNPIYDFSIEDLYAPDFGNLFNCKKYSHDKIKYIPYQMSRGCISNCSFCSRTVLHPYLETKTPSKVIEDLRYLKNKYGKIKFYFVDEAVNCSYKYLNKICDLFIKENINIFWTASVIPFGLDRPLLDKIKQSGCLWLNWGIESASPSILKSMKKKFTAEEAAGFLKLSYQSGIENKVMIISGYPHETKKDVELTAGFIKNNSTYIYRISFCLFELRYGTPIFAQPEKYAIENIRPFREVYFKKITIQQANMFHSFAFDECNGFKWNKKVKHREQAFKKLFRVTFKYVAVKSLSYFNRWGFFYAFYFLLRGFVSFSWFPGRILYRFLIWFKLRIKA
jgi:radical SAM superfamily enzyme YgiQ (UPF0313 family)